MRYNKTIILIIAFAVNSICGNIFGQILKVGENDLNLGIGFGTPWIQSGYYTVLPPLTVSLDHGFRDDWGNGIFTLGGCIGIARYAQEKEWHDTIYSADYTYGYNYTSTLFAARATYHYELFNGLDTYVGLMGGFRVNTNNHYGTWPAGDDDFDTDANFIPLGRIFIGAKYSFSDKVACFAELGYGISYVTMGVSFRI
jgi:hypothetical protein